MTKKVTFETEFEGPGKNPWGVDVAAFEAEGKISRKEFGLTWNQALEAGGVLVGDDIKITIEVQAKPSTIRIVNNFDLLEQVSRIKFNRSLLGI